MKSSLRAALALGALALGSTHASASTYLSGAAINLNPGSSDLLVSLTPANNPAALFTLTTSGDNFVTFALRDTDDDGDTIDYSLSGGSIVGTINWFLIDNGTPSTYSYLLSAGTYLLSIDTDADVSSSTLMTSAVPLPAAAWLFGSAVLGFGALRRKQKSGANAEMATV